jgi:uncharacterized protein (TIRG00374 family)
VTDRSNRTILRRFRRGVILGIVVALVVYVAYAAWAGAGEVAAALARFSWALLVPLLLLSGANYALRWVRWELYLRALGIRVPTRTSMAVFLAGLAMTVTPGKVGEFLKSYLLKATSGVPMAVSAPVVLVERITDLLSLVVLASFGVASYGGAAGVPVLVVSGVALVAGLLVLRSERLTGVAVKVLGRLPLGHRVAPKLAEAAGASRALLGTKLLGAGVVLGAAAWACECTGYWLAFRGFGGEAPTFAVATFAYAFSTVLGVVSPGGLGPTDIGLVEIARQFTPGLSREVATAASFLVRLCTLWFAVLLGAKALLGFRKVLDVDVEAARAEGKDQTKPAA